MKKYFTLLLSVLLMVSTCTSLAKTINFAPGDNIGDFEIYNATNFNDDRAFMYVQYRRKANRYCVDKKGRVIFAVPSNMIIRSEFVNGLSYAVIDGTAVLIDVNGKIVISPEIQDFGYIKGDAVLYKNIYGSDFFSTSKWRTAPGREHASWKRIREDERQMDLHANTSVLKAGYIVVAKKNTNYQGETYQLGVLNTKGEWVLPLSDQYGSQNQIRLFLSGKMIMIGNHIGSTKGLNVLDLSAASLIEGRSKPYYDNWAYFQAKEESVYKHVYHMEDGTRVLDLNEKYPTMYDGNDFLGDHAPIRFRVGGNINSSYFVGIINKSGDLLFEPLAVGGNPYYGMISEQLFFTTDAKVANRVNVYNLEGSLE